MQTDLLERINKVITDISKHVTLPKIEVKIKPMENAVGWGLVGKNKICIAEQCATYKDETIAHIVTHELGHAVYSLGHDVNCPVMKPAFRTVSTREQQIELLKKCQQSMAKQQ